jgi:GTP-binding protein
MRQPVVAIVGRPNVGKSTLFNRLARRRISIVEDTPGVTRDRLYAEASWDYEYRFTIIDTGGLEADPDTELFSEIREQCQLAIDEADVVLFVVDARAGVTPPDVEVAKMLRRSGRPLVVAANKVDSPKQDDFAIELYELGVGEVFAMSAEHGRGIEDMMVAAFDLLPEELREGARKAQEVFEAQEEERELDDDKLVRALDEAEAAWLREQGQGDISDDEGEWDEAWEEDDFGDDDDDDDDDDGEDGEDGDDDEDGDDGDDGDGEVDDAAADEDDDRLLERPPVPQGPRVERPEVLRLCVIGKPNAGKSSLVNKLLGEERHLVTEMAGTTVDAVDSMLEHGGRRFRLIDTAGIRRKRSISQRVEKFAVVSALKGMDRADMAIFLLDATQGLTEQDLKVAAFAHDKGRAMILAVNKWDLAKSHEIVADELRATIRDRMPFLSYVPVRFISAKTGRRVFDLLDLADEIADRYFARHATSLINRVLQTAVAAHPPPVARGKRTKLYFAAQVATAPPTIVVACNDPRGVHFSYRRFLQNRFREALELEGTPLRLIFRRRGDEEGRQKNMEARKRNKRLQRQGRRPKKKRKRAR